MNKYIGVEIGGTKQQIGVGYGNGNIIVSRNVKLQYKRGAEDILNFVSISGSCLMSIRMCPGSALDLADRWSPQLVVCFVHFRFRDGRIFS